MSERPVLTPYLLLPGAACMLLSGFAGWLTRAACGLSLPLPPDVRIPVSCALLALLLRFGGGALAVLFLGAGGAGLAESLLARRSRNEGPAPR